MVTGCDCVVTHRRNCIPSEAKRARREPRGTEASGYGAGRTESCFLSQISQCTPFRRMQERKVFSLQSMESKVRLTDWVTDVQSTNFGSFGEMDKTRSIGRSAVECDKGLQMNLREEASRKAWW